MNLPENELREAVEGLGNTDILVRKRYLSMILEAGEQGLFALLDLLGSDRPQMQLIAIRHIPRFFRGGFKPEQAIIDCVLEAMQHSSSKSIKRQLLFLTAKLFLSYPYDDPRLKEFLPYLFDNDPEVRLFFINFYSHQYGVSFVAHLAMLLEDEDPRVVAAAEQTLRRNKSDEARFAIYEWEKRK